MLFRDGVTLALHEWREERKRDQNLFAALPALLQTGQINIADLDRIAVGLGPGSFSGVRIAIAAVSALALPSRTPLCGVSSVEALASRIAHERESSSVAVIGDARRERLWMAVYGKEMEGQPLRVIQKLSLLPATELRDRLPPECCVVTTEWDRLEGVLQPLAATGIDVIPHSCMPHVSDVARLAAQQPASCLASPLDPPQPLYLHPAVFVPPRFAVR